MLISATSNKFITWPVMSTPETKTYPINFQQGTNEVNSQHLYSTHWIHCNTLLQHFAFLWRQNPEISATFVVDTMLQHCCNIVATFCFSLKTKSNFQKCQHISWNQTTRQWLAPDSTYTYCNAQKIAWERIFNALHVTAGVIQPKALSFYEIEVALWTAKLGQCLSYRRHDILWKNTSFLWNYQNPVINLQPGRNDFIDLKKRNFTGKKRKFTSVLLSGTYTGTCTRTCT